MTMADRIVVMAKGKIEQIGTPSDIYDHPRTRFVASFIGSANFFEGAIEKSGGEAVFKSVNGAIIPTQTDGAVADPKTLVIRPERIDLKPLGQGLLDGSVVTSIQLGALMEYGVELLGGDRIVVQAQRRADTHIFDVGEKVSAFWRPQDAQLLGD